MKAILYARFSPRPKAEECDSIESQLADCTSWCRSQGHEIIGTYSDAALSGADHDRPALWQAIGELRRGWLLVVRNVDRLSRDHRLSVKIELQLAKQGAKLASVENGGILDESPEQELIRIVLGGLAQYQRKVGNKRTSAKMRRHQANGRIMGGIPYGFQRDEENPERMIPHAGEQEAIDLMRSLEAEGMNPCQIADELNRRRIPSRSREWHRKTIGRILARAAEPLPDA